MLSELGLSEVRIILLPYSCHGYAQRWRTATPAISTHSSVFEMPIYTEGYDTLSVGYDFQSSVEHNQLDDHKLEKRVSFREEYLSLAIELKQTKHGGDQTNILNDLDLLAALSLWGLSLHFQYGLSTYPNPAMFNTAGIFAGDTCSFCNTFNKSSREFHYTKLKYGSPKNL
ncbi:hypothetical protein BPOR_0720g00020 [Botrytis porri]|uniref:Uncharacterized protein n=1 Tax=Botrytis porri TaxID=87229 RepID=A0A4Z1KBK4_9HELO|nr:hypothetical protein BPOR_0720g00020 [Botrytis porri]